MSPEIKTLPSGSSAQRSGLSHQAIEDYLKTIYSLAQTESPVSTSRLAEARSVRPASATGMIRRLRDLKLVHYTKHQGVALTASGEKLALEVLRHHRLIELYLIEALGFSWDEVHDEADRLEHVISEQLEERIAAALGHPTLDPHGDPIPSRDLKVDARSTDALLTLSVGQKATIARIVNSRDSALLRYLAGMGLTPGAHVEVVAVAPFEGPLTLRVDGAEQIVGYRVAAHVEVEAVGP